MTTKRNYRPAFAGLLLGGLFLMVQTASAQIWSSVGSTCTPDEDTVSGNLYDFNNGTFQFDSGKTGSIKARCHVINPKDDGSSPGWDTLTVGYWAPDGTEPFYQVYAQLVAVNKNTGKISPTTPSFYSNTSHVLVPTSASITFCRIRVGLRQLRLLRGHQRGADDTQRESGRVVCEAEQEQLDRDRESEPARVSAAAGRLSTPPGLTLKLADLRTGNKPGQPFAALDLHAGTEDHLQFPNREAPYRSGARQWAPPSYRWVRIGLDIHFTARSLSQKRRLSMTRTKNSQRAFAGLLLGGLFLMAQTASAQIWSSVGKRLYARRLHGEPQGL